MELKQERKQNKAATCSVLTNKESFQNNKAELTEKACLDLNDLGQQVSTNLKNKTDAYNVVWSLSVCSCRHTKATGASVILMLRGGGRPMSVSHWIVSVAELMISMCSERVWHKKIRQKMMDDTQSQPLLIVCICIYTNVYTFTQYT